MTREHLCIAMEYAPGGDLFRYIVRNNCLPEDSARWFFQQLIITVDYCHRKGIANRDIKLQNLLLDGNGELLKVCDFGYSKVISNSNQPDSLCLHQSVEWQSNAKSRVGTAAYLAPEVLSNTAGQTYDGKVLFN